MSLQTTRGVTHPSHGGAQAVQRSPTDKSDPEQGTPAATDAEAQHQKLWTVLHTDDAWKCICWFDFVEVPCMSGTQYY